MIHFSNLETYNRIILDLINERTSAIEFEIAFTNLWRKDRDKQFEVIEENTTNNLDLSKTFSLTKEKNKRLAIALDKIFTACDVFEPDPLLRSEFEYNESDLRGFVNEVFTENADIFLSVKTSQ